MAELHLTGLDDDLLDRLRERAQAEGTSVEGLVREELAEAASGDGDVDEPQTLRMPPADRSFRTVDPVDAPGISASELLIRDRRR
jgi:plasmid stability protein